jgi:hypothetical protein
MGENNPMPNTHIAIMREPYLSAIFDGKKTIESRFTIHKILPYGHIEAGDKILWKKSGGMIEGEAYVALVSFRRFTSPTQISDCLHQYAHELCIDEQFIQEKAESAHYGTLIFLRDVKRITPYPFKHVGQSAWIILPNQAQLKIVGESNSKQN